MRREVTLYRLVRDSAAATRVKSLHDFRCQVCGTRIETAAGYYAEAAHIVPLGRGYDGPDDADNLLCLCPNDHVRFDYGGLFILDDMIVVDREGSPVGRLKTVEGHTLDVQARARSPANFRSFVKLAKSFWSSSSISSCAKTRLF